MVGKRIRQLRQEKRLSLTELAERAEVAKSYLSTIERDIQVNPSIQFLEKVATVLNVDVQTLLNYPEEQEETEEEGWMEIARLARNSGIDKMEFKQFLEYQIWKRRL